MKQPLFSVLIPAHNEEQYIGKCIQSIRQAERLVPRCGVEIIVAANRCTDRTADIARESGAVVIDNQERCISSIRNAAAKAAHGKILVTIDADSVMTQGSLREIRQMLFSGKYIGGGTTPQFERMSLGILCSGLYIALNLLPIIIKNKAALSGAMFWCFKKDFDEIGGFDESLVSLEDMDFAARLNRLGRSRRLKYGTLRQSRVITSARKFDQFGDWYLIKNRRLTKRIFTGKDRAAADHFYYDVR